MKYELIGKNDYLNPIDTILENRGVENKEEFLNPTEKNVIHYSKLKNIERAVSCLLKHINKNSEIFVQVDSDVDGYVSSAALINYLKFNFPDINIKWRVHNGKEHRIILDTIPKTAKLIIAPDSSSSDYEEHKLLKEMGKDIIVLDHHETEKESENAIVVNNQLSPEYENKSLTGVGIVYKFLQALDDRLNIKHADYYLDLVAIGLIADMADTRNLETRYLIKKGLKKINNKFLKTLFEKQSQLLKGNVNTINVQFYIAPLINALIRVGDQNEKQQLMLALLEIDKNNLDVYISTVQMLQKAKRKQDSVIDKSIIEIENRIKEKELLSNKILIVNVTNILDKNLTGLTANRIAKKYRRPTLLVRQKDDSNIFAGSARGYENGYIRELKPFLINTGKFILCEGHPNAHGIEIEAEKLIEVNNIINEKLKNVDIDINIYYVDFIIPAKSVNIKFIKEINKYNDVWGYNVESPLIAIQNLEINNDEIQIYGKNKNVLKFIYNGIEYVKFKSNIEEYEKIAKKTGRLIMNVVGKCSINEFRGEKIYQIIIDDYEITAIKKKEFIF